MAGGLQVKLGLDGNRIGESDVAALEGKADAVEGGLTFENIDPAEDGGPGHRAAQPKVGIARKASDGGPHLEFGRSHDVDIELDIIERRVGGGDGGELAAALEISAEVEARSHGHLVDADVAGDGGGGARPTQCSSASAVELTPGG